MQAWENLAHGAAQDTAALVRRHPEMLDPGVLETVRRALAAAGEDPEEARALGMLYAHLLEQRLGRATADLDDRIANLEATARVEVGGAEIPYRRLPMNLAAESDPERRGQLQSAGLEVLERLNPLRVERQRAALAEARSLGLPGLVELSGFVRQVDLRTLAPLAEEILSVTAAPYRTLLAQVLERESGVPPERARPRDLQYLVRGHRHERLFPAGQLFTSLEATLRGMGIRTETQAGLSIDSEDRPGKSARAFCLAVSVPDDVRLCVRAGGGPFDYDCLYHEMGHAQHYLNTRETRFEFRCLGSMAVSETYASLLEGLTAAGPWLRRATAASDRQARELRVLRAFRMLYLLRRYAARVLYELRLHDGDLDGAPAAYLGLQERALGVHLEEEDASVYLAEVDDLFYCAEYLRGWLLEAALERVLRVKYGEAWFEHPGAGAYLMRMWEKGGRHRAEELLEKVGQRRWSVEPVLQRVRSLCGEA